MTRETDRLLLRPPLASDLDPFVEIHGHPDVLQHLTIVGPLKGRVGGWRMLALMAGHWHLHGYGQWTVVEKSSGAVIGRCGLWNPEGWPGMEVGWVIRREVWGNGYATEAARAAIDFGFNVVGADHLISLIRPHNAPSIRVAEKIGEHLERVEQIDGSEVLVYGISKPR